MEGTEFKRVLTDGASGSGGASAVGKAVTSLVAFPKGFIAGCDGGMLRIFERVDDIRLFYKVRCGVRWGAVGWGGVVWGVARGRHPPVLQGVVGCGWWGAGGVGCGAWTTSACSTRCGAVGWGAGGVVGWRGVA
jgi:hypothetical protein